MAYNNQTFTSGQPITANMIDYIDDAVDRLDEVVENLMLAVYPVGSIYLSVNSTSPATLFGGTWEQIKDRFLLCSGDSYTANTTGGSASVSHTHSVTAKGSIGGTALTVAQIPAHNHSASTGSAGAHTHTLTIPHTRKDMADGGGSTIVDDNRQQTFTTSSNGAHTHSVSVGNTGSGQTHTHTFSGSSATTSSSSVSTLPPYLTVYA